MCAGLMLLNACTRYSPAVYSGTEAESLTSKATEPYSKIKKLLPDTDLSKRSADIDLTSQTTQMAYVQLSNMMLSPDEYIGKTVKLRGRFAHATDEDNEYFVCYLLDETACCSQSLEFQTDDNYIFPDDYPPEQSEITVYGVFDTYEYNGFQMYRLIHAETDYT